MIFFFFFCHKIQFLRNINKIGRGIYAVFCWFVEVAVSWQMSCVVSILLGCLFPLIYFILLFWFNFYIFICIYYFLTCLTGFCFAVYNCCCIIKDFWELGVYNSKLYFRCRCCCFKFIINKLHFLPIKLSFLKLFFILLKNLKIYFFKISFLF